MVYRQLDIGIPPKASEDKIRKSKPLTLEPGNSVIVRLSPQDLQSIKNFLASRKFQLADITKVRIQTLAIFFNDGIMWSNGFYYRPNPNKPGSYERIT